MVLCYLSIDEGTTNTKSLLVGTDGAVLASAGTSVRLANPARGHYEQDAEEIWAATLASAADCLAQVPDTELAGVAVSNQRESVLAWSRSTGAVLGPVVGWQDSRTAGRCAELATAENRTLVASRTGLHIDPMYSAPKLAWLAAAAAASGHRADDLCLGTVDAFLVWRLTGGEVFACDASNAARTLLYDIHTLAWDEELCDLFGVPLSTLPEVRRSDAGFGATRGAGQIPDGTPVRAVLGDSHAALYGQGCDRPGLAKVTFGTGSSVMAPTPRASAGGAVDTTLAWLTDAPTYAREGNILATGAALDTIGAILGLAPPGRVLTDLAATVDDSGGVHVVPAFSGLASPHWDREAVGIISGVVRDTTAGHVARATVEAVAHQVADVVEEIERSGDQVDVLRADGGASVNPFLMQVQADLTGKAVHVLALAEASALGVATLALRADGYDVPGHDHDITTYQPRLAEDARQEARAQWRTALRRSRLGDGEDQR